MRPNFCSYLHVTLKSLTPKSCSYNFFRLISGLQSIGSGGTKFENNFCELVGYLHICSFLTGLITSLTDFLQANNHQEGTYICRHIKNKVYRLPYPDDFALQILLFRGHNFFFRPRREPFRRLGGQCFRDTLGCTCQMRLTDELMRLQISVHHLVFFSIIMAAKITKSSFKEIPYVKFGRPALKYLESESVLNGYLRYEN